MQSVNFEIIILIGVGGFMIGHYFKELKLEKIMKGAFLPFKFISDAAYPMRLC